MESDVVALRELAHEGTDWHVWEVRPNPSGRTVFTLATTTGLEDGSLCFESATQKRRLAPIPADWTERPDARLAKFLGSAPVVPPRPGRGSYEKAALLLPETG